MGVCSHRSGEKGGAGFMGLHHMRQGHRQASLTYCDHVNAYSFCNYTKVIPLAQSFLKSNTLMPCDRLQISFIHPVHDNKISIAQPCSQQSQAFIERCPQGAY